MPDSYRLHEIANVGFSDVRELDSGRLIIQTPVPRVDGVCLDLLPPSLGLRR